MLRNHLECDGCHREVHEDQVEIVGEQVLCDSCRKKLQPRKTIPRLGAEDLESLKTELSEMKRVKAWLEKRLEAEGCTESKQNLESTLAYVANSIECFEHDLSFMSKSEPA